MSRIYISPEFVATLQEREVAEVVNGGESTGPKVLAYGVDWERHVFYVDVDDDRNGEREVVVRDGLVMIQNSGSQL